MSTNKLSHLKEWEKIYLEVTREISTSDDSIGLMFCWTSSFTTFVNDDDTFYTLEELKALANDGMPKQGEIIQVRDCSDRWWIDEAFVAFFDGKAITTPGWDEFNIWNEWRFPEWFEEVTLKNGLTY